MAAAAPDLNLPFLEDSIPQDGARDVPVDALIGLRFSKLLLHKTVSSRTVSLQSAAGTVDTLVVPAESGRLTFVTPKSALLPGTKYFLTLQGPSDAQNLSVPY